jgi:type I restriction enzyme S subunit
MVERIELGEFLDFEQPTKYLVKSTEYDNSYDIPVLTAGQSLILGYTNETEGIYNASKENPTIIFDDFTTSFHWIDFKFKVKSSAMKMLRPKKNVNFRYIYFAMMGINYVPGEHQRHWISKYSHFRIPIPSVAEQNRIVTILDTFTASIDNLKEQIVQRRKQIDYYRNKLYGESVETLYNNEKQGSYKVLTIAELGTITRGKRFTREDVVDTGVPALHYGDMYTYYGLSADRANTHLTQEKASKMRFCRKGDVVIVGAGENDWDIGVGVVWLGDEKAAVHDACYILEHEQNPMYISHYLRSNIYHLQLRKYVSDAKICSFSAKDLGRILIPIPDLEKQRTIVQTLDTFEASIKNLETQLDLRQKQYEYYRNKLLTFE